MHEITTLRNGVRIVSKTMRDTDSVTVNFVLGAGGRYEDLSKEYGVSHFLEHLLFKGTKTRPSPRIISEEIDSVGGYTNAYTTEDHTSYYIKLPKNYFGLAFNILADIITEPLFDQIQIDRERKVILEEMKVFKDDPARYVDDLVGDLLWPHDTLKTNVIGNEHIISTIDKAAIQQYFKSLYTMDNLVISVAGNISHIEVVNLADKLLSKILSTHTREFKPVSGGISETIVNSHFEKTNQSHMLIVGRAPEINAHDEPTMKVLSAILGSGMSSRLFMNVRENKGLAYSVYMSYLNYVDSGKFEIYAGVSNEKIRSAVTAICDELQKIQQKPIEFKELNKAKEQLRGRYIMGLEGNSAVADMQGSQLILSGKLQSLESLIAKIDEVTAEDVQAAAKNYLFKDNLRLAILGPTGDDDLRYLESTIKGDHL